MTLEELKEMCVQGLETIKNSYEEQQRILIHDYKKKGLYEGMPIPLGAEDCVRISKGLFYDNFINSMQQFVRDLNAEVRKDQIEIDAKFAKDMLSLTPTGKEV